MLYVGSCRYMYLHKWNYFPARLHTTKEIIFFLEHIDNIQNIMNTSPSDLINKIFGDCLHHDVMNDTKRFLQHFDKKISKLILEICSRKLFYMGNIPLNHYYTDAHRIGKYNLVEHTLTDSEIENDIDHITHLAKQIFNEDIEIHIIPHLNLKSARTNDYIPARNELVKLLETISEKKHIPIHNIGKYLETNIPNQVYLEEYMKDSTHYTKGEDIVTHFLKNRIYALGE